MSDIEEIKDRLYREFEHLYGAVNSSLINLIHELVKEEVSRVAVPEENNDGR